MGTKKDYSWADDSQVKNKINRETIVKHCTRFEICVNESIKTS
jgi:hypothetical protein